MKSADEDGKWEDSISTPLATADRALGCPQVPLPIVLIPATPQGSAGGGVLGHLQVLVGFKVQTHLVRKGPAHQWL